MIFGTLTNLLGRFSLIQFVRKLSPLKRIILVNFLFVLSTISAQNKKKIEIPEFGGVLEFNAKHDFSKLDSNEVANSFNARRIRLVAKGELTTNLTYLFQGAFEGSGARLFNAFVNYQYRPWLNFKIGQYKNPFSYEGLLPIFKVNTVLRGEGVDFIAKPLGRTGGAFRDIGFSIHGKILKSKKLTYNFRIVNGNGINKIDNNNKKDLVGMLSYKVSDRLDFGTYGFIGSNEYLGDVIIQKEEAFGAFFNWAVSDNKGLKIYGEYNKGIFYSGDNVASKPVTYQLATKYEFRSAPIDLLIKNEYFTIYKGNSNEYLNSITFGSTYNFKKFCWVRVNYVLRGAGRDFVGGKLPQETTAQGGEIGDLLIVQTMFKF